MKRIEDQTNKFNQIKKKLQFSDQMKLTESPKKSILEIINFPKTKSHFILNSFPSVRSVYELNKNKETKIKEKNKFFTKKYPEQNENKEIKAKELTQNEKIGNYNQNKNDTNSIVQKLVKANLTQNNAEEIKPESYGAKINLLNIENEEYGKNEVNKLFKEERIKEEKKILDKDKDTNEKNNEIQQNNISKKKKYMSDEEDEEIEIDNSNLKNNNEILKKFFVLSKKESGINFSQSFDLFDESKMIKDNENSFYNMEEFEDNYNNIKENDNKNENNDENNININPLQKKENQNKENDAVENNSSTLKICIPKDDNNFAIKMPLDDNKIKEKKYLGKKTKISEKPTIKKPTILKNEQKINREQKIKHNIPKNNNKVILDEDEEEGKDYADKSKKKNNINNILFKSPISKIEQKNNNVEPFLTKEGNKFTLMLESETKNSEKNNKLPTNENEKNKKSIKNQSSDSTPKKNKNIDSQTKNINIDDKNNNNKNKINLINKNKNGSPNIPSKDIIINEKYESKFLNDINKILMKIDERLSKEKIDKNFMKDCFKTYDIIKNTINNPTKNKNIYLQILSIMKNIFYNLYENKICKNYVTEMNHIFESVEKYFKEIKNDKVLNNNSLFTKRKIAFKYAFAKLELKNMDEIFLKGIIPKTNNENNNNNEIEGDNNSMKKFTKISKRYIKTSKYMLKELKEFREKINNSQIKNMFKKYESCPADIQMSPHFMSYNRLFYHCYIILSFYNDYKKLNEEINEKNKSPNSKDKIDNDKNKNKSNQIKHNLNGYGQTMKFKEKESDKSVDKKKDFKIKSNK